jgi:hypothetical protein
MVSFEELDLVYAYFDVLKFKQDNQVRNCRALKFHVMNDSVSSLSIDGVHN